MEVKNYKGLLFCLVAGFLLNSCATGAAPQRVMAPPQPQEKVIESARQVKEMNERLLMGALAVGRSYNRDYKIGPEDLLEITVFEVEKLSKTVRVSAQGNISLPLIGGLKVKGKTANELEGEIRDLLAEKYVKDPQVSVFIKEYRNQRVSVIGMVEKPGSFDVTGQKTVLDMLGMAGGLKEDAGQLLFLIRSPSGDESDRGEGESAPQQYPLTWVIDLEELLIKGNLTLNFPTSHGDVINIPASGKIFVGGEVVKPGGFSLKGKKLTVTQAIALAEGIRPEGDGSEIKIFRLTGKDEGKETIAVDFNAISKGQADDLYLKENDILVVPKSGVKSFLFGLRDAIRPTFGIGFYRPF